jgi:DNA excision repair protein ERCC-4
MRSNPTPKPVVIDIDNDDEDAWDAVDEIEGQIGVKTAGTSKRMRKDWIPDGMEPVLEELPKWSLLADVLQEIEEEMMRQESLGRPPSSRECFPALKLHMSTWLIQYLSVNQASNTVLIMTSSSRSVTLLNDFLSTMDSDAPKGAQGREMMEDKLRLYLWWKGKLSERKRDGKAPFHLPDVNNERPMNGFDQVEGLSDAMKLKDKLVKEKNASRRRVRGGAPASAASGSGRSAAKSSGQKGMVSGEEEMRHEAEDIADLWVSFPFHRLGCCC